MNQLGNSPGPWYAGITPYQWLALAIASLGWVFDVFEGQIIVASMSEAMNALLPKGTPKQEVSFYLHVTLAAFLVGGALGGVVFGMLSDRIGRTRTMIFTILVYSLFTCVSAFAQNWWQLALMRCLVGAGVGGEWAVAAALVAEVFPQAARARSLGIFHASSVLGTYLAVAAGLWIVAKGADGWRWGFGIGAVPAVLTLFIRWGLREPDSWRQAREAAARGTGRQLGRFSELFTAGLRRNTLVGAGLGTIGLATFWGIHIFGKEVLLRDRQTAYLLQMAGRNPGHVPISAWQHWAGKRSEALVKINERARQALRAADEPRKRRLLSYYPAQFKSWEMFGMLLVTTGGGLGLLSFGPLCERLGRRATFFLFQLGGFASTLAVFGLPIGWTESDFLQIVLLGGFGFLTLGMHAGFAIYFPELFPTRLRGTGSSFCFNVARILAAPILVVNALSESQWKLSMEQSRLLLSGLFLIGAVLVWFAPETKGRELPE